MPTKKREKPCSCGATMTGKIEKKSTFAQITQGKTVRYTCKECGNTKQVIKKT